MQLQQNTLFADRYLLKRLLGRGGFSEIWLADDRRTHVEVAVKIYAPGTGLDDDGIDLFSQEFSIVFNLNHNNLLRPSFYDCHERQPYLILPYCERGSVAKLVGKMSEAEIWKFLKDMASALAYLHTQTPPIVHQDIKPDNVLMDSSGRYMLTDFGISTKIRSTLRKSVNRSQSSGGTIAYMAPERFGKTPAAVKASDVWSLGATVFELMTGDVPFGEQGGLIQKGGAEIPEIQGDFSDKLKNLVYQCLSKETWDRPTAEQLYKGENIVSEAPIEKRETQQYAAQKKVQTASQSSIKHLEKSTKKASLAWMPLLILITDIFLAGILIKNKNDYSSDYNSVPFIVIAISSVCIFLCGCIHIAVEKNYSHIEKLLQWHRKYAPILIIISSLVILLVLLDNASPYIISTHEIWIASLSTVIFWGETSYISIVWNDIQTYSNPNIKKKKIGKMFLPSLLLLFAALSLSISWNSYLWTLLVGCAFLGAIANVVIIIKKLVQAKEISRWYSVRIPLLIFTAMWSGPGWSVFDAREFRLSWLLLWMSLADVFITNSTISEALIKTKKGELCKVLIPLLVLLLVGSNVLELINNSYFKFASALNVQILVSVILCNFSGAIAHIVLLRKFSIKYSQWCKKWIPLFIASTAIMTAIASININKSIGATWGQEGGYVEFVMNIITFSVMCFVGEILYMIINNTSNYAIPKIVLKKLSIKKIPFLWLLLFFLSPIIAYVITDNQREKDLQKITAKIDEIFNGKDEVCDYTKTGVRGSLSRSRHFSILDDDDVLDNNGKALYELYSCKSGGWTVYTLKKLPNGYDYIEYNSSNMGFKIPESIHYEGIDYGYGIKSEGYDRPTYRGSVQEAYDEAMKYLSVEKDNQSYVAGVYNKIVSLDEIRSTFYYVDNVEPTNYSKNSYNAREWERMGKSSVYNDNWIVWYRQKGKHYEIVLNKDIYQKKLAINIAIAISFSILIIALLKYIRVKRSN